VFRLLEWKVRELDRMEPHINLVRFGKPVQRKPSGSRHRPLRRRKDTPQPAAVNPNNPNNLPLHLKDKLANKTLLILQWRVVEAETLLKRTSPCFCEKHDPYPLNPTASMSDSDDSSDCDSDDGHQIPDPHVRIQFWWFHSSRWSQLLPIDPTLVRPEPHSDPDLTCVIHPDSTTAWLIFLVKRLQARLRRAWAKLTFQEMRDRVLEQQPLICVMCADP
jgi:hypothetical protein